MKFAIVGAGFSGAVLARELAVAGHSVSVFEIRTHIGGNCYTERDDKTGILLHRYGPHVFHTDNLQVWQYVNSYTEFVPYVSRVKANTMGKVFSLPINLHTINQFFNQSLSPKEAKVFIDSKCDFKIETPRNFEELALKSIGSELYEAFFKGYTIKQWGLHPSQLPASVLKRLPVRFNYNDNYFSHAFQGIPKNGYTPIFEALLDHKNISLFLGVEFSKNSAPFFDHVFCTGPIDKWFKNLYGHLGYRTLDFKKEYSQGDYQGCAIMNYNDLNIPFTRITEHKHFSPWENHENTVIFKETSRDTNESDIPYYPIRLANEKATLKMYIEKARGQESVSFLGRLGTYRYLDMDVTIGEALAASETIKQYVVNRKKFPVFFNDPL
jgi:UDP-galactopyranose mutase